MNIDEKKIFHMYSMKVKNGDSDYDFWFKVLQFWVDPRLYIETFVLGTQNKKLGIVPC